MDILHDAQKIRKAEFDSLLNSVAGTRSLLLFPLRLETHFRTGRAKVSESDLIKILSRFRDLLDKLIEVKSDRDYNFIPLIARIREAIDTADYLPKEVLIALASLCKNIFRRFLRNRNNEKYSPQEDSIIKAIDEAGYESIWLSLMAASESIYSFPLVKHSGTQMSSFITSWYEATGSQGQSSFFDTAVSSEYGQSSFLNTAVRLEHGGGQSPGYSQAHFPGAGMLYNFDHMEAYRLQALVTDWIYALKQAEGDNPLPRKNQKELCVRIFPDEIFLDSLTDRLTEEEISDGKNFWIQWFIASGSKKSEYEAWQVLCSKHFVYRAAWIARQLKPKNINDFKKGAKLFYRRPYQGMEEMQTACEDIYRNLFAITLDESGKKHPGDTEEYEVEYKIRKHIRLVKESLFQIDRDVMHCEYIVDYLFDNILTTVEYLQRRLKAFLAFYRKYPGIYGNNARQMELWDVDYTMLKTIRREVDDFLARLSSKRIGLEEMINKYLTEPMHMRDFFPRAPVNYAKKPDMPTSHILPDRFMLTVETKENKKTFHYGKRVKRRLQLGIDPNEDIEAEPYNISEKGDLEVNGGIAWMADYDKAEEAGMAITIPIDNSIEEFNYIYALGIRSADYTYDAKGAKKPYDRDREYLHSLFNSHNYTAFGLEMLKPGTPTNIVEGGKPGYDSDPAEEMKWRYEVEVEEAYIEGPYHDYDAKKISDVLRLHYESCWGRVKNFANMELSRAEKANKVLWKHFRENISDDDGELKRFLDDTEWFFLRHVKAGGVLPSFRIGEQPYGILPVTDFMKLNANIQGRDFVGRLNDLLIALANKWKGFRDSKVVCAEKLKGPEAPGKYLEMAGLTPYSATFHERTLIDSPLLPRRDQLLPVSHPSSMASSFSFPNDAEKDAATIWSFFHSLSRHGYFEPLPVDDAEKEVSLSGFISIVREALPDVTDEEGETLVAGFFDLFTHRLDAWFTAILNYIIHSTDLRYNASAPKIGAFGWVFNLEENTREEVKNRDEIIQKMQLTPKDETDRLTIYKNTKDKGEYVVAPSIQHAITAAILRGAYVRTKKDDGDSHMCVNLSSMRARQALRMISGIKSGMSTGIILGADLERYLHEAYRTGNEMDKYVYPLRKLFPQTVDLEAGDERARDYVMEVINGEALLNTFMKEWDHQGTVSEWLKEKNNSSDPLWWYKALCSPIVNIQLQIARPPGKPLSDSECLYRLIERMTDSYDALSDLLLAEGVHRLVQGNRAAYSAIISFMADGKGNLPDPSVLDTPMEHVVIANKTGIALPECKDRPHRPMCLAEPSLNLWLEQLMGTMDHIWFCVGREDETGKTVYARCTLEEVGVTPIEYLYLSTNDNIFLSYLETRWRLKKGYFTGKVTLHTDEAEVNCEDSIYDIDVTGDEANSFSIYENELRINHLRSLVLQGRAMKVSDWVSMAGSDGEDEIAIDMKDMEWRYTSLRAYLLQLNVDMAECLKLLGGKVCDDEELARMYELSCRCVESGLLNSLPAYNPDMFIFRMDHDAKEPEYHIYPIAEQPAFDRAEEMQVSFIKSFAFVQQQLEERLREAEKTVAGAEGKWLVSHCYSEAIQKLLLDNFQVFPRFTLDHALTLKQREDYDSVLKRGISCYDNINETIFAEWQADVAEVREGMKHWHHLAMFQSVSGRDTGKVSILQTMGDGESSFNKWLGSHVDDEADLHDADSLVIYNSGALKNIYQGSGGAAYNGGIIIDSWLEFIPYKKQTAGMVFRCDRPDNEAPQALLLALHPRANISGEMWNLDCVTDLLDSTRFMMMNRAVEPDFLYQDGLMSLLLPLLTTMTIPRRRYIRFLSSMGLTGWRMPGDQSIFDYIVGGEMLKQGK